MRQLLTETRRQGWLCSNRPTFRRSLWPGLQPPLCLTSLAVLETPARSSPQPALDSLTEEETAQEGPQGHPLQAHPPEYLHVYTMLYTDTACLHQALSTQQEKVEVSRLPSSEAASADPEPQREALLSAQSIFFSFFLCLLLLLVFIAPDGNGDRVLLFLDSVL